MGSYTERLGNDINGLQQLWMLTKKEDKKLILHIPILSGFGLDNLDMFCRGLNKDFYLVELDLKKKRITNKPKLLLFNSINLNNINFFDDSNVFNYTDEKIRNYVGIEDLYINPLIKGNDTLDRLIKNRKYYSYFFDLLSNLKIIPPLEIPIVKIKIGKTQLHPWEDNEELNTINKYNIFNNGEYSKDNTKLNNLILNPMNNSGNHNKFVPEKLEDLLYTGYLLKYLMWKYTVDYTAQKTPIPEEQKFIPQAMEFLPAWDIDYADVNSYISFTFKNYTELLNTKFQNFIKNGATSHAYFVINNRLYGSEKVTNSIYNQLYIYGADKLIPIKGLQIIYLDNPRLLSNFKYFKGTTELIIKDQPVLLSAIDYYTGIDKDAILTRLEEEQEKIKELLKPSDEILSDNKWEENTDYEEDTIVAYNGINYKRTSKVMKTEDINITPETDFGSEFGSTKTYWTTIPKTSSFSSELVTINLPSSNNLEETLTIAQVNKINKTKGEYFILQDGEKTIPCYVKEVILGYKSNIENGKKHLIKSLKSADVEILESDMLPIIDSNHMYVEIDEYLKKFPNPYNIYPLINEDFYFAAYQKKLYEPLKKKTYDKNNDVTDDKLKDIINKAFGNFGVVNLFQKTVVVDTDNLHEDGFFEEYFTDVSSSIFNYYLTYTSNVGIVEAELDPIFLTEMEKENFIEEQIYEYIELRLSTLAEDKKEVVESIFYNYKVLKNINEQEIKILSELFEKELSALTENNVDDFLKKLIKKIRINHKTIEATINKDKIPGALPLTKGTKIPVYFSLVNSPRLQEESKKSPPPKIDADSITIEEAKTLIEKPNNKFEPKPNKIIQKGSKIFVNPTNTKIETSTSPEEDYKNLNKNYKIYKVVEDIKFVDDLDVEIKKIIKEDEEDVAFWEQINKMTTYNFTKQEITEVENNYKDGLLLESRSGGVTANPQTYEDVKKLASKVKLSVTSSAKDTTSKLLEFIKIKDNWLESLKHKYEKEIPPRSSTADIFNFISNEFNNSKWWKDTQKGLRDIYDLTLEEKEEIRKELEEVVIRANKEGKKLIQSDLVRSGIIFKQKLDGEKSEVQVKKLYDRAVNILQLAEKIVQISKTESNETLFEKIIKRFKQITINPPPKNQKPSNLTKEQADTGASKNEAYEVNDDDDEEDDD